MIYNDSVLTAEERTIFALRSLYKDAGYSPYKMSKFEDYDLYVKNKDFLVSKEILTFTDTNGKLKALKPDVTLSIIKNTRGNADKVCKVYYDENVYRVSRGSGTFCEIMQAGLECIGDISNDDRREVLMLAAKSLSAVSDSFALDIAHMQIADAAVAAVSDDPDIRKQLFRCIESKNANGINEICEKNGIDKSTAAPLINLTGIRGKIKDTLPQIKEIASLVNAADAYIELADLVGVFSGTDFEDKVSLDFSSVGDMRYYNGILFNGFIDGISSSVISGGQYDNLLKKMNSNKCGIGFAFYLDLIGEITR